MSRELEERADALVMALEAASEPWAPRRSADRPTAAIEWHATDMPGTFLTALEPGAVTIRRMLDPVQYRLEVNGPDGEPVHMVRESPTSTTEYGPIARVWKLAEAQIEAPVIATISRLHDAVLARVDRQRG